MFDFGLRAREDFSYGGIGGFRRVEAEGASGQNGFNGGFGQGGQEASGPTYPDFFPVAQHDFATRMQWSATPRYEEANHPPRVTIEGPLDITAQHGEEVHLVGSVSDPDGDSVTSKWWQFQIVDSYEGEVSIESPTSTSTTVVIPDDAEPGDTIHMILEATDSPQRPPRLPVTRYQRVIITVADM